MQYNPEKGGTCEATRRFARGVRYQLATPDQSCYGGRRAPRRRAAATDSMSRAQRRAWARSAIQRLARVHRGRLRHWIASMGGEYSATLFHWRGAGMAVAPSIDWYLSEALASSWRRLRA